MQTTDITSKEEELNIVFGPYLHAGNGGITREAAYGSLKYLYTDLTDIRKYYIRLGFHLNEFNRCDYYRDFGYYTLEDFCENNLGLDKGAVSRCINVYKQFNASNDVSYYGGGRSVGCAMNLSERWKDYSYTQLCEMLPLTESQREKITPDMSVKQIREYKKSLKKKSVASMQPGNPERYSVASTQPEDTGDDSVASTQPEDTGDDSVASTQLFDFEKYENKKGVVLHNYIKKCDPIEDGRLKYLYLFDVRGKEIAAKYQCDILLNDDNDIVICLYDLVKPLEWDEENND